MKRLLCLLLLFIVCLPPTVHAQSGNVRQYCAVADGTDVTITTTAETVVGTLSGCTPPSDQINTSIKCSGIMTTSANSTTYKVRIRRNTLTGTALGDAVAETIKVTAGGTEAYFLSVTDQQNAALSDAKYVCTIEMAGADGTTTSKWNFMEEIIH